MSSQPIIPSFIFTPGGRRAPRYTTPAEERRIRACVGYLVAEAGGDGRHPDRWIVDRYTYLFRTVFNSMLRDRAGVSS